MTMISLIVAVLMVYSVNGRAINNTQHSDESKEIDDIYRNTAYVCGSREVYNGYRNSRNRFTDDDILDDYFDDDSYLDKIIGGTFATYGDFPWQVLFYLGVHRKCGGVVIAEYWVLSAAHCFDVQLRQYYKVVVGDHSFHRVDTGEETFDVEAIFRHEKYNAKTGPEFDIALVKIAPTTDGRGIQFTRFVQPICLPDSMAILSEGTMLTVSGWGIFHLPSNKSSPLLMTASMPVISREDCRRFYPKRITPNMICAGYKKKVIKTCAGDSGGPATFNSEGMHYVFGIVSFGKCWLPHYPTVFANVPMFRNWIESQINLNKPASQNYIPRRRSE